MSSMSRGFFVYYCPYMVSAPRRWFRNPLSLLLLVAALSAFVIQSGELGTSDTSHRLQTTHSW